MLPLISHYTTQLKPQLDLIPARCLNASTESVSCSPPPVWFASVVVVPLLSLSLPRAQALTPNLLGLSSRSIADAYPSLREIVTEILKGFNDTVSLLGHGPSGLWEWQGLLNYTLHNTRKEAGAWCSGIQ